MTHLDDDAEKQLRDQEAVFKAVKARLEPVKETYKQVITSLWLGNGGAALAVLSFMASTSKEGHLSHKFLGPLWCFVMGLICMGTGTVCFLLAERRAVRTMESANSLLDMSTRFAERPSDKAGLTLRDPRTVMALAAAVFFVAGCMFGLLKLTLDW